MILNKILSYLKENKASYVQLIHQATYTSKQSASVRGENLETGAKAILYKIEKEYYLFVLAANKKLDTKKIKTYFKAQGKKAKSTRFATEQELAELTNLVSGAVPPFGKPILNFDLFVDPSLLKNKQISFNAGSLTNSITLEINDYLLLVPHKKDFRYYP